MGFIPASTKFKFLIYIVVFIKIILFPVTIISGFICVFLDTAFNDIDVILSLENEATSKAQMFVLNKINFNIKNISIVFANICFFVFLKQGLKFNWFSSIIYTANIGLIQLFFIINRYIKVGENANTSEQLNYYLNCIDTKNEYWVFYAPFIVAFSFLVFKLFKRIIRLIKNRYL